MGKKKQFSKFTIFTFTKITNYVIMNLVILLNLEKGSFL